MREGPGSDEEQGLNGDGAGESGEGCGGLRLVGERTEGEEYGFGGSLGADERLKSLGRDVGLVLCAKED